MVVSVADDVAKSADPGVNADAVMSTHDTTTCIAEVLDVTSSSEWVVSVNRSIYIPKETAANTVESPTPPPPDGGGV